MIIVTAYHGTSMENAEKILKEGFRIQRDSKQYPNDLGHGVYGYIDSKPEDGDVYFMRSAKENAALFARQIKKVPQDQIAVLKFQVHFIQKEAINLNDLENRNNLLLVYKIVMGAAIEEISFLYKMNRASKRNQIDGVIFEYLHVKGIIRFPKVLIKDTYTRFNGYLSNFTNGRELVIRDVSRIHSVQLCK